MAALNSWVATLAMCYWYYNCTSMATSKIFAKTETRTILLMTKIEQSLVRHGLRVKWTSKIFSLTIGRSRRHLPAESHAGLPFLAVNVAGVQRGSCLYYSCRASTRGTGHVSRRRRGDNVGQIAAIALRCEVWIMTCSTLGR